MKYTLLFVSLIGLTACQMPQNNTQSASKVQQSTPTAAASKTEANIALDNAVAAYQAQNYTLAWTLFEQADELGHMKAARYFGLMHLNGLGVAKDPAKAFDYFQKAADKGDITSQYWLGFLYENGIGTPQNYTKALEFYTQSAQRGDVIAAPALHALGNMYEKGLGVKKNSVKANEYYQKAEVAAQTHFQPNSK
ncbi:tetratricopeptide repeat protein [Necropsobacter massiliensis]|uniref:tetratricopeptide repeat protein n=1 Tax=Necropsobacter massiliensis TaxID=1400001 RepID=UPI000A81CF28|nr:tetratricopeptide repeat protein [Necropsobacter massiliensis]